MGMRGLWEEEGEKRGGEGFSNECFRCKILFQILYVITDFKLSSIFLVINGNNLILSISQSKFLKFERQGLLQMEFL